MPVRMWTHYCDKHEDIVSWSSEFCPDCGKKGKYDGWHNSHHEFMGDYTARTGLKPLGPHRPLADKLFEPYFKECEECAGRGFLDVNHGEDWKTCPVCHGDMYLFTGTDEERKAIREQVLREYPDAAIRALG